MGAGRDYEAIARPIAPLHSAKKRGDRARLAPLERTSFAALRWFRSARIRARAL